MLGTVGDVSFGWFGISSFFSFSCFFSATIFYEHSLTFVWRQREILLNFYEHEAINWRRCIYFPFSCSRKNKDKGNPRKKAKAPVSYVTWIVSMYTICLLHHNSPVNAFPQASLCCNFDYLYQDLGGFVQKYWGKALQGGNSSFLSHQCTGPFFLYTLTYA